MSGTFILPDGKKTKLKRGDIVAFDEKTLSIVFLRTKDNKIISTLSLDEGPGISPFGIKIFSTSLVNQLLVTERMASLVEALTGFSCRKFRCESAGYSHAYQFI